MTMDRRTTLKWMLSAAAAMPLLKTHGVAAAASAAPSAPGAPPVKGYGTDPDMTRVYAAGEVWPLTFTAQQRKTAAALCDVIIPADAHSPSASSVGVVEFIDEWISAPYPLQRTDRPVILEGLAWMDHESRRRYSRDFAALGESRQALICDDICYEPKAAPQFAQAAKFFARYRDLTAGGFYTTPVGRKDLRYVGNVALASFEGPPIEVLKKVGLA